MVSPSAWIYRNWIFILIVCVWGCEITICSTNTGRRKNYFLTTYLFAVHKRACNKRMNDVCEICKHQIILFFQTMKKLPLEIQVNWAPQRLPLNSIIWSESFFCHFSCCSTLSIGKFTGSIDHSIGSIYTKISNWFEAINSKVINSKLKSKLARCLFSRIVYDMGMWSRFALAMQMRSHSNITQ